MESDLENGVVTVKWARAHFRDMLDHVFAGGNHVAVFRAGKPLAVLIPYEDFRALKDQLEDMHDLRSAERAIAQSIAEGDPVALRFERWRQEDEAEAAAAVEVAA